VAGRDPLAMPGEVLPSASEQATYWNRCQHNSWFFLAWHRMYLHIFEEIVAAEVLALGGPADWALPYWNYSKSQGERRLPRSFSKPTDATGATNPLFVAQRSTEANGGMQADAADVDLSALKIPNYSIPVNNPGKAFCGAETGFHHSGGSVKGIDAVPHGNMHGFVGGQFGWMSAFRTAALDPVFWVHHANIDRLWEVWLKRNAAHANPANPLWRTGVQFAFRDAAGTAVQFASEDVVSTVVLGFQYDDVSDPLPAGLGVEESVAMKSPELLGATEDRIRIGGGSKSASVPTVQVAGATVESLGGSDEPSQVHLRLENITSNQRAPAFDVYVGVNEGVAPSAHQSKFAGRIAMFGLTEASEPAGPNAGSGLSYDLDVTEAVKTLRTQPGWDPGKLNVLFVPVHEEQEAEVYVGRISVFAA
jgi:tyrosinase